MSNPLSEIATTETVEYALDRATSVERKHPLLSLIYRTVAEVLDREIRKGDSK